MPRHFRCCGFLALLALFASSASAESPFESALCRLFGCVVVSNGEAWEIFVFDPESGGRSRLWASSNGGQPVPAVDPSNLQRPATPGDGEGTSLGVDIDGDGESDLLMETGGNGFLDAGDRSVAFPLTSTSRISLAEREERHSFFVASNVPFTVQAEASLGERRGSLGSGLALNSVDFSIETNTSVGIGGQDFGASAHVAGLEVDPTVQHLGDLAGGPREILRFTHPTTNGSGNLEQQLVQITLVYNLGGYDLSQGTGEFGAQVEYSIQGF